ncbi:L-fuculose phosphate aldolase [Vibrio sp. MACH09]|uniref:L-fuculose-phosphate aldolase n=1 Tax=unclassified Vibrio TaxID=2614977 RepID=UPI0014938677|nr:MULTISPECIES: L-fuculose-phosphate aldolase [unclassified Vibrio]NOI65249.1 L-fuculose-phosphate aldolase [Vibrio sp. 99-8-1]GLO63359.1 L-fuculose phosphate aldolase [Vibrio sp. MACH09]
MNRKQLSQEIIDTCLEMTRLGLNQGTAGNISVRYDDGMLITPTGIQYEQLTPDHIVYVDAEGNFEQGKLPSSEWAFHLACYQAREEANAVVHNHAINCATISILNKPIPAIHYMVAVTGTTEVPCIPYATFGSVELATNVAKGIKQSSAILLGNHGCIATGDSLAKALWVAHEVEVLAETYVKILSTGQKYDVLSDEKMALVIEKFKSYGLRVEEK